MSTTPAGSVSSLTLEGEPVEVLSTPLSQHCIVSVIAERWPPIIARAMALVSC
jgi:hypothetical protein